MALGRVIGLWRYPVKSMAAETLSVADVGEEGIVGDRAFGVVDATTGKLMSAKRFPALLNLRPVRRDDGEVVIYEPSGDITMSDSTDVHLWLSERLGRSVTLVRAEPEQRRTVEMDLDDGGVFEFSTQPGSFFDGRSTVHVLSTASLAEAKRHYPDGDWSVERFRPAVLVQFDDAPASEGPDDAPASEGPEDAPAGEGPEDPRAGEWPEDAFVGAEFDLGGPAGVRLSGQKRMDRCIMVTRAQGVHAADKAILTTLARVHDACLGVGCVVTGVGRISVGDSVDLVTL